LVLEKTKFEPATMGRIDFLNLLQRSGIRNLQQATNPFIHDL